MKTVTYKLFVVKTGKLIASGNAKQCAETLDKTVYAFHNLLGRIKRGENKKYRVERYSDPKKKVTCKRWSSQEEEFLRQNVKTMSKAQLSRKLGRTTNSIKGKCQKLNINLAESELYKRANDTLCWSCKNYYNGCSWSKSFEPVEGWKAKKTKMGYLVLECPKFERG